MWLQKNERRLLRTYYLKLMQEKGLDNICKEKWYCLPDLVELLKDKSDKIIGKLPDYSVKDAIEANDIRRNDIEKLKMEIKEYLQYEDQVNIANNTLQERELITVRYASGGKTSDWRGISFKINGYELGMAYNGWWYKTGGMWWAEYKGHWGWAILGTVVAFLIGLLTGKLTQ